MFILVTFYIFFSFSIKNVIADGNVNEIDISTTPHKVSFDISNGKPGDTFTKVLMVKNSGTKDFKYMLSSSYLAGSEKFFNELVLTIIDQSGELYQGRLKDFDKLDPRNLKSNTNEEITFSIYIPYELGNEFQNLYCEFQFKYYVVGTLGGTLSPEGPKLPETGTNMFNILVSSVVLVIIGSIWQVIIYRRKKFNGNI